MLRRPPHMLPHSRLAAQGLLHATGTTTAGRNVRGRSAASLRRNRRHGAAATEFAIVAPIFLLLVIGTIELGRALMVQQVLINASRVGARQASTTSATTAEVEAAVQDYTDGVAVPGVTVTVSPDPTAAAPGDAVTVTTSVPFSDVSWMTSPWFLGGKTLTASSQMRKEGFE
ncbi:MAG: TadE/TadG family type IV pilus assembly protein [Pirellulales bacterium]